MVSTHFLFLLYFFFLFFFLRIENYTNKLIFVFSNNQRIFLYFFQNFQVLIVVLPIFRVNPLENVLHKSMTHIGRVLENEFDSAGIERRKYIEKPPGVFFPNYSFELFNFYNFRKVFASSLLSHS